LSPRPRWLSTGWAASLVLWSGIVGCSTPLGNPPEPPPASATAKWHARNGPLVAEYLETLPASGIGQPLKGIRLSGDSDAGRWLEGQTYLGVPTGLPVGVSVRLMDDGRRVLAYVWVDESAEDFSLEPCEAGEQEGIRARLAGGGPYAWTSLKRDHGVVYTACPPEDWIPADAPSRRSVDPSAAHP